LGGTGSLEGIEGTVDIATICGTAGGVLKLVLPMRERNLESEYYDENNIESERELKTKSVITGPIKVGYVVQTIKVKSNMPLPIAP
jgi:hypothetical protein